MIALLTPRNVVVAFLLLLLAAVPIYAAWTGNAFLVTLFTRIVILGMAATTLNLILGYGGMVSFGHAVYLGIGGYAVGILAYEGVTSGFVQWPLAIIVSALFALIVGALSLRTRGVYFIMITLAFAQLLYYFGVGLDRYGADDGLGIRQRSQFAGLVNLSNRTLFYYLCLALLLVTIYLTWRLVNSRFGMVIQGSRSNDRRMRAIGFPTFRYRLTAFVMAAASCGCAGALLANHTGFISPATMHWTRSGDLIVMVVLGGMASSFGPLIGALVLLSLEEALPIVIRAAAFPLFGDAAVRMAEYWQIVLGPLFLLVVLFARGGIDGLVPGASRDWRTRRYAAGNRRPDQAVRRPHRVRRNLAQRAQGRVARDHRTERGRQDHLDRAAGGRDRSRRRAHPLRRRRRHRAADLSAQPDRTRPLVPDHLAVPRFHRPRQRGARGTGARRPLLPLLAQRARRGRPARAGARRARPRGTRRAERRTGLQSQSRRAPAARDRHGARHDSAHAAARRADGRNGTGGERAHGQDAARAQARADDPADRA